MVVALLAGGGSWARAQDVPVQLAAQAQAFYEQRADLDVAARATEAYREILTYTPQDLGCSLKLCELLVWIGAQAEDSKAEPYYRELIEVAQQARKAHPNDPGPVYWLGVGQGMLATVAPITEALSLVKQARANMRLLLSLDPTYCHGGADRVLGRIYSKLPFFIGGDNDKAEEHYKQAIDRGPHYWLNHLYLAELYHHEGYDAKAKQLLRQVAAGPTIHGLEPECKLWQNVARKYLIRGVSSE
ncbi:MAG: TRAP transporter TatT component family protein [Deltaproteobacteria bacterium]|nr:TRAP transporter TatT component family protein [Deltaproteobacteria bacterium]